MNTSRISCKCSLWVSRSVEGMQLPDQPAPKAGDLVLIFLR